VELFESSFSLYNQYIKVHRMSLSEFVSQQLDLHSQCYLLQLSGSKIIEYYSYSPRICVNAISSCYCCDI
jgi:hypothetical protein